MKKWQLSRRTFLRGAGTCVALPMLEAMLPSVAHAQTGAPRRMFYFYTPCGIHMQNFTPAATGSNYALTPILEPLASLKSDVLVLTGLANRPARPDGPGDHASGTGAFLTCAHPYKTSGSNIQNGISVDQVAANTLKGATRFASLELGTNGGGATGDCDSGYSCAYARNIAWAGPTTPLGKETQPANVFDRLFGGMDPNQTAAAAAKRKLYKQSVLDSVKADAEGLNSRIGASDRRKLDEYLTGIREIETRMNNAIPPPVCDPGARPTTAPADIRELTRLMLDLSVLALQCDQTRVITFMLENAGSNRVFPFLGLSSGHHSYSHHQDDPVNFEALTRISTWEVSQYAYLIGKMKAVVEPDGSSLLDNSMVFFSSEISDGNRHNHDNLPVLVAGKGGGALSPGRHVRYTTEQPLANLFLSMLQGMGVDATSFGDSTGPLPLLKV